MSDATAPFEMEGLDHLVIRCVDLDAMRHFYCDLLGMVEVLDRRGTRLVGMQLLAQSVLSWQKSLVI